MKLRVGYCDGLAIEVVGQDMDAFVRSSLWKVRLAAVKRRALDSVGQIILFPPDLTRLDIDAVLAKLGDVAARNPELEIELDGSLSDAEQQQNAGIIQKAAAGNAIKARSAQVDGEFAEFSRAVDAMMARPLRDRQMWDAFFMCSMGKSANFSVPGSGKTASTLGAFGYLRFAGKVDRLIVVGPMSSFGSWVDEWVSCFGSPAPRVLNFHDPQWSGKGADARRRELSLNASRYDLILLNYEMLAGVAEQVDALVADSAMLVFDEVHKVKQVDGVRASAALAAAARARYVVALTGTPIPNSFRDIYNLLHLLYPQEYDSYFGYTPEYLDSVDDNEAPLINARLQPFFCRTNKKSLRVPDASPDIICEVAASDAENELLRILKTVYRRNPLALIVRVLQLESNPALLRSGLEGGESMGLFDSEVAVSDSAAAIEELSSPRVLRLIEQAMPGSKFAACADEVERLARQGKSVVVWCFFRKSMFDMAAELNRRGFAAEVVCGSTDQQRRGQVIDSFKQGRTRVLVTNPQTLAESVSLHSVCHDAVYLEYSYNLVHLLQSKDRIHRLGLPEGQYTQYRFMRLVFDLGSQGWSLDENIYNRLREKEQRMLQAIDQGVLEAGFTDESDLRCVFEGLFDTSADVAG